jgi:hypothetical protein
MRARDAATHASLLGGNLARRQVRNATSHATGTLVLAGKLERRILLRASYKGKDHSASLRKDGYISYAGKRFPSPTAAAVAIVGRNVNGWRFWNYQAGPKGWVPLSELRK